MRFMQFSSMSIINLLLFTIAGFAQNVNVGQVGPSFTLDKFGGGTLSLDDFPGQIKFIYFFGST